jgi:hypothetical protein
MSIACRFRNITAATKIRSATGYQRTSEVRSVASRQPTPSPKKQEIRIRLLKYASALTAALSHRIDAISRNRIEKLIRNSFAGLNLAPSRSRTAPRGPDSWIMGPQSLHRLRGKRWRRITGAVLSRRAGGPHAVRRLPSRRRSRLRSGRPLAQSANAKVVVIGAGKDGLPLILDTK